MPADVLVAYGSKHGSTREIAEAIAETFRSKGVDARAESALTADPHDARAVVVGAALYTGRIHAHALRFLRAYEETLAELPLAVFGSGPRTLDPRTSRRPFANSGAACNGLCRVFGRCR